MSRVIYNANIILPDRVIKNGSIEIENDLIKNISSKKINGEEYIDAKGYYVSPGFIDIHTHGAGGCDFMDGDLESFKNIAKTHMEHGTTSLIATSLSGKLSELCTLFKSFKKYNNEYAKILGIHLEGPYFSKEYKGAQDPKYIINPTKEHYNKIIQEANGSIMRWSFAPELEGSKEFIKVLNNNNIKGSIGHTSAQYKDVLMSYENGIKCITHLYSCMSSIVREKGYRKLGVIESAYLFDMYVEVIADGCHLPLELLELIYKIKGSDKIILVTDSMRASGTNDKKSVLGSLKNGEEVVIKDGVAYMPDMTCFAGSIATADRLVRTMLKLNIPINEVIKMITKNPADYLNLKDVGVIDKNKKADLIIFDKDINIKQVFIDGICKYDIEEY